MAQLGDEIKILVIILAHCFESQREIAVPSNKFSVFVLLATISATDATQVDDMAAYTRRNKPLYDTHHVTNMNE
jgi:hypothetical protein